MAILVAVLWAGAGAELRAARRHRTPPGPGDLLPETPLEGDFRDALAELIRATRTNWFGLLAYLAFTGVTLMGVQDADFFIPERETSLPLVGVDIPTFLFFWVAPGLGAIFYAYLHIKLLHLWQMLARIPSATTDTEIADTLPHWLVTDLAFDLRGGHGTRRHMRRLTLFVTRLLTFWATPLVLAGLFIRSMPAHDEVLTILGCGLPLFVSLYICSISQRQMRHLMHTRDRRLMRPYRLRLTSLAAGIALIGWFATEGTLDHYARGVSALLDEPPDEVNSLGEVAHHLLFHVGARLGAEPLDEDGIGAAWWSGTPLTWALVPADLANVDFVGIPADWRDYETARKAFRVGWCGNRGLPLPVCGPVPTAGEADNGLARRRAAWCDADAAFVGEAAAGLGEYRDDGDGDGDDVGDDEDDRPGDVGGSEPTDPCAVAFAEIEEDFADDWETERDALLATLTPRALAGRDFRRADLREVRLEGADLSLARMERANLGEAHLEGADLSEARLDGADFGEAGMELADLQSARLVNATLGEARLTGADLSKARLVGANLREARMESADLSDAQMEGAEFPWARMEGANLRFAQMEAAFLRGTWLDGADLRMARLDSAHLQNVRLRGADLSNARLDEADLSDGQLQRVNLREARMDGVNLSGSNLRGGNLFRVKMPRADLTNALMDETDLRSAILWRTNLRGVRLRNADLRGARMGEANLTRAILQGADLQAARMDGASLGRARLEGADLRGAHMEGADLRAAQFPSAAWAGASLGASPAHAADFRGGTDLKQDHLSSLIGNAASLLPDTPDPETGAPIHVWTCWDSAQPDPPGLEHLIKLHARYGRSEEKLRDPERGFFCEPGERPQRTGTPWPLDADPPWGAQKKGEGDRDYARRRDAWAEREDARRAAAAKPDSGPD